MVIKNRDKALGWERTSDAGDPEIGVIFVKQVIRDWQFFPDRNSQRDISNK